MKKVLVVGYNIFPDLVGGTEIAIYELINLLKDNYDLAITINETNLKFIHQKKFKVLPIKTTKTKKNYLKIIPLVSLIKNLIQFNPHVLLVFTVSEISMISLIYAKLFHKKIIVRSEGTDLNFIPNIIDRLIKRSIIHNVNQILYVSLVHRVIMKRFFPQKAPIQLLNGTKFIIDKIDTKEKSKGNLIRLLFVGTLRPVKNVSILLQAIQLISQQPKFPKFVLNICGDGPLRSDLEQQAKYLQIEPFVSFKGIVDRENVSKIFTQSDVFILPSISEGFPLVIAEALGAGCAIICSELPNIKYLLKENINSLYFPANQPDILANKIISLFSDEILLHQMQRNNIILAKKFSWENIGSQLRKIINSV